VGLEARLSALCLRNARLQGAVCRLPTWSRSAFSIPFFHLQNKTKMLHGDIQYNISEILKGLTHKINIVRVMPLNLEFKKKVWLF
jgi:hypothetical protein